VNQDAAATGKPQKSVSEVALGFIDVANEAMCRPIRALTQARGFDASQHVLACFGGAGGQHACAIARQLGMQTVFVHRYASILSAVGMGLASVVREAQVCSFTAPLWQQCCLCITVSPHGQLSAHGFAMHSSNLTDFACSSVSTPLFCLNLFASIMISLLWHKCYVIHELCQGSSLLDPSPFEGINSLLDPSPFECAAF
jgi:Hydantoinase/oxoprolinase